MSDEQVEMLLLLRSGPREGITDARTVEALRRRGMAEPYRDERGVPSWRITPAGERRADELSAVGAAIRP